MAALITHIVLALSVILPKQLPEKAVKEFIIGTCFPDIRYVVPGMKREDTHVKNVSIDMVDIAIQDKNFFQAGLLFHSFVDNLRDGYMDKKSVYKIMPKTEHAIKAIKFLEDNILYDRIKNIDQIIKYFDTILDEELAFAQFGISKSYVKNWHKATQIYCEKRLDPMHGLIYYLILKYPWVPTIIIRIIAFIAYWLKILPDKFLKIMEVIYVCEKNEKLIRIINNFYDNFGEIAKNC